MVDLPAAYAHCARIARDHYENFPVASWLLPPDTRPHVAALYAFARGADDLADEGTSVPERRIEALEQWRAWLHEAMARRPVDAAGPHEPVFVAAAETIRSRGLPLDLFDDLVSAFAQDVRVKRYDTWAGVLDYCRRSANPVGRLVLRLFGYDDPRLDEASDHVCTALQLTNFWQDLPRDWSIGRLYLPEEEWRRAGADIDRFNPAALTPEWRSALAAAAARTRRHFAQGRPVCDGVSGRLRYELRLTWVGGRRILDRLEAAGFDAVRHRPTLGLADLAPALWRVFTWPVSAPATSPLL